MEIARTVLMAATAQKAGHPGQPSRARSWWLATVVVVLLALYGTMAWTASLNKGPAFDEALQLAVGYNIWLNNDLRFEGANGDLVKRWATLPYLVTRPHFVGHEDRFWREGMPYELAYRFFFQLGNEPGSLLRQGRAMVTLLGVATGLLVFGWARSLFGTRGGLIALGLFAFSPHMQAFGGIVSTDMSITLTLFAATWCIWRLLHEVTLTHIAVSLLAFGLLVLAKPSALVILPLTALLVMVKLAVRTPIAVRLPGLSQNATQLRSQLAIVASMVALHAFAGASAIWAHYSFRHAASPAADEASLKMFTPAYEDGVAEPLRKSLQWVHESHLLPEGFYRGVHNLAANDEDILSFMNGTWAVGGRAPFFPYALWVKTSPVLMLLLLAGAVAWWRLGSTPSVKEDRPARRRLLYEFTPLFALILCYLGIAMSESLNIGHRHVLPIYPALYVLAGAVALFWADIRSRLRTACLGGALAWMVWETTAIWPNPLAYFGPQAGGPETAYKRLVDSSLDWGMSLPGLKQWQEKHDPKHQTPLFLAYFGTDTPERYDLRARQLPGFYDRRPIEAYAYQPGYYAISATLLQGLYTPACGPWRKGYETDYHLTGVRMEELHRANKDPRTLQALVQQAGVEWWQHEIYYHDALRFGRLSAWLRHTRKPDAHVDHSILIWKLSYEDLAAALAGPPVELVDQPLPGRHYRRHGPVERN